MYTLNSELTAEEKEKTIKKNPSRTLLSTIPYTLHSLFPVIIPHARATRLNRPSERVVLALHNTCCKAPAYVRYCV